MAPIKSLFGGNIPKPAPVQRLPDANDPEAIEARRKKIAETAAASGRASTNLAGNNAGGSYVSDKLGV